MIIHALFVDLHVVRDILLPRSPELYSSRGYRVDCRSLERRDVSRCAGRLLSLSLVAALYSDTSVHQVPLASPTLSSRLQRRIGDPLVRNALMVAKGLENSPLRRESRLR